MSSLPRPPRKTKSSKRLSPEVHKITKRRSSRTLNKVNKLEPSITEIRPKISLVLIDEFMFFQFLNIDPIEINSSQQNLKVKNSVSFNKHTFSLLFLNVIILQSLPHTMITHPCSAIICLYLITRLYQFFHKNSVTFDMGFKFLTLGYLIIMIVTVTINLLYINQVFQKFVFEIEIVVVVMSAALKFFLACWFFARTAKVLVSKHMVVSSKKRKEMG